MGRQSTRQENVGEENKTNLLRILFSSPTFSCLIEEAFHKPAKSLPERLTAQPLVLDHCRFFHVNDLFADVGDIIADAFQMFGDEQ